MPKARSPARAAGNEGKEYGNPASAIARTPSMKIK